MKNKPPGPIRICQVKGCISGEPPKYEPIVNVVVRGATEIMGQGYLGSAICDRCRNKVKLKDLLNIKNWAELSFVLTSECTVINTPCYDSSFLTFRKLKQYTVH